MVEQRLDVHFDGFAARVHAGAARLASNNCAYAALPKNSSCAGARHGEAECGRAAEAAACRAARGSATMRRRRRTLTATRATCAASSAVSAKIDMASSERQAGTTPRMLRAAERRFVADEIVEGRGHAAGAGGVGAQRETREAQRHGHGRAARRTAADVLGIECVPAGAVRRARAHEAGGELIEVGLAERDGAGVDQRLHHRRRVRGVDRRTPGSPRWSAGPRSRCCP